MSGLVFLSIFAKIIDKRMDTQNCGSCRIILFDVFYLFLLAATQTGSSLITGLLTAITPERLWGTYGSSR